MKTAVFKYEQVDGIYSASIYQIVLHNLSCVGGGWME